MYFKKKITIRSYTRLKTLMSKQKAKDIVRKLTKGKKPQHLTKIKALKDSILEFVRDQLSQENDARAVVTAKEDAGNPTSSAPRETTVESATVENATPDASVARLQDEGLETLPGIQDSSDRIEQMKLSKMKRNISNISKESTAKSEVKPKNEPWGGMFCCAGGRGGDKA